MRQDMAQSCGIGFGHMRCVLDAGIALAEEALDERDMSHLIVI